MTTEPRTPRWLQAVDLRRWKDSIRQIENQNGRNRSLRRQFNRVLAASVQRLKRGPPSPDRCAGVTDCESAPPDWKCEKVNGICASECARTYTHFTTQDECHHKGGCSWHEEADICISVYDNDTDDDEE